MSYNLQRILPSLREKKRYIAFTVQGSHSFDQKTVYDTLESSIVSFLGELGTAQAGIQIMIQTPQQGIVKVHPSYLTPTITAINLIHHIHNTPIAFRTHTTSGLLNKTKTSLKGGISNATSTTSNDGI